jgi:hypothetical protein
MGVWRASGGSQKPNPAQVGRTRVSGIVRRPGICVAAFSSRGPAKPGLFSVLFRLSLTPARFFLRRFNHRPA